MSRALCVSNPRSLAYALFNVIFVCLSNWLHRAIWWVVSKKKESMHLFWALLFICSLFERCSWILTPNSRIRFNWKSIKVLNLIYHSFSLAVNVWFVQSDQRNSSESIDLYHHMTCHKNSNIRFTIRIQILISRTPTVTMCMAMKNLKNSSTIWRCLYSTWNPSNHFFDFIFVRK